MESVAHNLEEAIRAHEEALIRFRRRMHQNPELSTQEFATTQTLVDVLEARGLEVFVRPEGNGLYADLTPPGFVPGESLTVAIRSDIDALPIAEETGLAFASQSRGVMHACGHDVHMACVLGSAVGLSSMVGQLPGRMRFIYQHNEESLPGGADEMVAFGAMEGVDYVLGLHCDPELDVGKVGLRAGSLTAAADLFDITIEGKMGHSARPQHSVDALFVATQVATALYQAFGRQLDARDPLVFAIGSIHAGDAHNIIPGRAEMRGTVRTLSKAQRAQVEPILRHVLEGVCATWNAQGHLNLRHGAPAVINSAEVIDVMRQVASEILPKERIYDIPLPSMGGEDFSEYLERAPGAMVRLGTGGHGPRHKLHSPRFSPDEKCIRLGATLLARTALRLFKGAGA